MANMRFIVIVFSPFLITFVAVSTEPHRLLACPVYRRQSIISDTTYETNYSKGFLKKQYVFEKRWRKFVDIFDKIPKPQPVVEYA
jgi:hypothetical protein